MKSQTETAVTGPRELRDPRSREYAIQTMRSLKRFLESKTFDAKHVADELRLIEQYKHWEVLGFEDMDSYVRAEVGIPLKQLKRRLAQDLAADLNVKAAAPEGTAGPGRGHKTVDNVHGLSRLNSNSAERIVRRLKRDAPEIAEALGRGEFKSARAAGIAAGIIKLKTPLDQIRKLWRKLSKDERHAHRDWTLSQCATCGKPGTWEGMGSPLGEWCDACCEEGMKNCDLTEEQRALVANAVDARRKEGAP